jgi:branched-chain amino acid aminotransferase/para-aminobenzoate synthetase component 1
MKEFVWLNDALVPLDQARVSVNDRGFQYGDGFFETIRAEKGRIFFLKEHLARLSASAAAFRLPFPRELPWEDCLGRLLAANGLEGGLARLKIMLTRGLAGGLGLPAASRPPTATVAFPPPPHWIWLPATWRWNGYYWQWIPGHWGRAAE